MFYIPDWVWWAFFGGAALFFVWGAFVVLLAKFLLWKPVNKTLKKIGMIGVVWATVYYGHGVPAYMANVGCGEGIVSHTSQGWYWRVGTHRGFADTLADGEAEAQGVCE